MQAIHEIKGLKVSSEPERVTTTSIRIRTDAETKRRRDKQKYRHRIKSDQEFFQNAEEIYLKHLEESEPVEI